MTLEPAAPAADRTIVVPGLGRLTVEPDVATVRLGVAITRPTATSTREAAAETMTAILEAIAAAGVERRDVRTSLVGLSPITDYSSERGPRVTGYQLTNSVELTVRDLSAAGKVSTPASAPARRASMGSSFVSPIQLRPRTPPVAWRSRTRGAGRPRWQPPRT